MAAFYLNHSILENQINLGLMPSPIKGEGE